MALGAIASYSEVRVVFCDAESYDEGYLPPAQIAHSLRVKGHGGTVLQPGIDLLQTAEDFPPTAPILIITDAACDVIRIKHEHAILTPAGPRLPFTSWGRYSGCGKIQGRCIFACNRTLTFLQQKPKIDGTNETIE